MKVKELIEALLELPQDDEIVITSMDDYFFCTDFSVHSNYYDGQAQEIILPYYLNDYTKEPDSYDFKDMEGNNGNN